MFMWLSLTEVSRATGGSWTSCSYCIKCIKMLSLNDTWWYICLHGRVVSFSAQVFTAGPSPYTYKPSISSFSCPTLQVHCEVISDLTFLTQGEVACLALVAAYHTLHGCLTFVTALCNKFSLLVHILNVKSIFNLWLLLFYHVVDFERYDGHLPCFVVCSLFLYLYVN